MEKHKLGRMNLYKTTWLVVDRFKVSSVYSLIKRMYHYMADRFISLSHVHKACCRGYLQSTTSICTFQHRFTTLFLKFQFYSQIDQFYFLYVVLILLHDTWEFHINNKFRNIFTWKTDDMLNTYFTHFVLYMHINPCFPFHPFWLFQ